MPTKSILILGLLGGLSFASPGKAGVYIPDLKDKETAAALTKALRDPVKAVRDAAAETLTQIKLETDEPAVSDKGVTALPFKPQFRLAQNAQMELGDSFRNTTGRQRCQRRVEELRKKLERDPDNVTDSVSLSGYLIRLGQPEQAIQVLEGPARGAGRNDFMVAGNLATAWQLAGDAQRADDYSQQAIKNLQEALKKGDWPGLSKEQLAWYKEAEEAQLKLNRIRRRELAAHGGKAQPFETVDDLFGVKFVGEDGNYEAGAIAEKLPPNALGIIEQLILWMPNDPRLYWLLGEVLNARGDVENAYQVLEQCVDGRKINAAELKQHRLVVGKAAAMRAKERDLATRERDLAAQEQALNAREEELNAREQALTQRETHDKTIPGWLPDPTRLVAVGGGVGVIVLLLGYLQVREMRRRRQAHS